MKIYRHSRNTVLTQPFGASLACGKATNGVVDRPFVIRTKVNGVCPVGYVSFYEALNMLGHSGEDWSAKRGDETYFDVEAPTKWWGRVEVDDAQGMNVDIFSIDPIPFDTLPAETSKHARDIWEAQGKKIHVKRRFTHGYKSFLEDKPLIHTGGYFGDGRPEMKPEIKLGDLVVLADSTGASGGDHTHKAIKFTNGKGMTVGGDNGYMGAVTESQWYEDKFVLDVLNAGKPQPTTVQRLETLVRTYELQGKHREARWIRSIIQLVIAFGG